jgi:Fe2+ or Zn2+ uptake regulation protein
MNTMRERQASGKDLTCTPVTPQEAKDFEEFSLYRLREAGFRITMPRVQVIRALADTTKALSAYEIHEKIVSSGGKIDVVSVYRILSTLEEVGLVHHIGVANGYFPARLEREQETYSQHFVCQSCECITEVILSPSVAEATVKEAEGINFQPLGIKVEVLGLCSNCKD